MSAMLSSSINSEFTNAKDFDKFFGERQGKSIRRTHESREQPKLGAPSESCKTNLFFGFFFDGTKNNYINAESNNSHSNVARLYDCFPGLSVPGVLPTSTDWQYQPDRYTHFFKVYAPGVSSPFKQVGDSGEGVQGTMGGASGALAERRIIWALVQAINNVHRYFLKEPLVTQNEMDRLFSRIVLNKYSRRLMEDSGWWSGPVPDKKKNEIARQEFSELLRKLHRAVSLHWPDEKSGKPAKIDPGIVKTIYVSAFGFSRGATQARAFTNWLLSLCRLDAELRGKGSISLGGFPVEFDFLGLFDTVASVGAGNTLGNSMVGRLFDGHGAWADAEDSLRIPAGIKCLHLVAAHEIRRSFPLDSISVRGSTPEGCEEIVVPGVHSDVGCGYCPREQGRGTDGNGNDMLSRIPLLMMYKAARVNGAPLKLELANSTAQARFSLAPETINAFNAYMATCKETSGPIHRIMREQARKQIEWRLARRVSGKSPIQGSASFLRASTFDQNDLYSAAREFEEEVSAFTEWLKEKGNGFRPSAQKAGFGNDHDAEWEEIATWWQKGPPPSPEVLNFFDNYVHDSRAWFKLIPGNPDDEQRMHALLRSWVSRRKAAQVAKRIGSSMRGRGNSAFAHTDDGLSDEQSRAVDEYARTGKIPRMLTEGREPFDSSWKSWGLAGKAGYLRFRKIYGGWDSELISSTQGEQTDELTSGRDENNSTVV